MIGSGIVAVDAALMSVPLNEPFAIAGGASHLLETALVRVRLADGTEGWGEASPLAAFNGETAAAALAGIRRAARGWPGRDARAWRPLLEGLEHDLPAKLGSARAALGMALLDAVTRRAGLPLRALFGGAETRVVSDVTVTLGSAVEAGAAARRIRALGVKVVKIKVGADPDVDAARVRAVAAAHPRAVLTLDANQGFGPRDSLALLRRLRRAGVEPAMFEQPAKAADWDGLAEVSRKGRIPVAADESMHGRADALALCRRGLVQAVNVKLMKMGILEAWDCAEIARAFGVKTMIGGMVETSLAMGAAAHLAAGLGGFAFVDLDTPLWLSRDPMRGVTFGRGGVYDLSRVAAGIGVVPGP